MEADQVIRAATPADAAAIAAIGNDYILNTTATFAEEALTEADILEKLRLAAAGGFPWLVATKPDGRIAGYASAGRFRPQNGWKLAECSIYLAPEATGRGIGRALYTRLLDDLRRDGRMVGAMAVITMENTDSIRFHEAFGFELTVVWRRSGFKLGRWCDGGVWMLRF